MFELILGTPNLRAAIAERATFPEMVEVARQQGYRTRLEDGRAKAMAGWTTPDEVIRAVFSQAME